VSAFDDDRTPYEIIGESSVRKIADRFYDHMEAGEEALAALHERDEDGAIKPHVRERFFWFLSGWLGGPPLFMDRVGHPRLRMRHGRVAIDESMKDAWLRAMFAALDEVEMPDTLRTFLRERFEYVATFLINQAPPAAE
jgi:hemoglobin